MNTTLPKQITPRGDAIINWIETGSWPTGFIVTDAHMFLEAARHCRRHLLPRQTDPAAMHFLMSCGVSRNNPGGMAVLAAAALTGDRQATPLAPWMHDIREIFGETVASLVEAVTLRPGNTLAQVPDAILKMEGRLGALAQALRTAQVAATFTQHQLVLACEDLPLHVPTLDPTRAEVAAEIDFQGKVPRETEFFAEGFNQLFYLARQINFDLKNLVAERDE